MKERIVLSSSRTTSSSLGGAIFTIMSDVHTDLPSAGIIVAPTCTQSKNQIIIIVSKITDMKEYIK